MAEDAVVLCRGSFYDLRVRDGSLDFVFMSQAFHHAADPRALLHEIRRAIAPDGVVLIIGEHDVDGVSHRLRNAMGAAISRAPRGLQSLVLGRAIARQPFWGRLGKPEADSILGDHYYFRSEYRALFEAERFTSQPVPNPDRVFQSFVLLPA